MSVMTENKAQTTRLPGDYEPVDFRNVREGDTLSFSRRDNGFGGTGDILRPTGIVIKVTDKTVTVKCETGWGGTNGVLRRANWNERDVHRIAKATRRPYNAENVQYVDEGNIVTAVWCSDPAIDPKTALENSLLSIAGEVPYEVEAIAEATRFFKREGADFSGWVVSSGVNYGDSLPNKREAMKHLRWAVADRFTR